MMDGTALGCAFSWSPHFRSCLPAIGSPQRRPGRIFGSISAIALLLLGSESPRGSQQARVEAESSPQSVSPRWRLWVSHLSSWPPGTLAFVHKPVPTPGPWSLSARASWSPDSCTTVFHFFPSPLLECSSPLMQDPHRVLCLHDHPLRSNTLSFPSHNSPTSRPEFPPVTYQNLPVHHAVKCWGLCTIFYPSPVDGNL